MKYRLPGVTKSIITLKAYLLEAIIDDFGHSFWSIFGQFLVNFHFIESFSSIFFLIFGVFSVNIFGHFFFFCW